MAKECARYRGAGPILPTLCRVALKDGYCSRTYDRVSVAVIFAMWFRLFQWHQFGHSRLIKTMIFAPAVWLWNYVGKVIEARSEQRGQLTFSFKKPEYALEFMRLNQEGDERSQKPREAALESFRLNQ